MKVLFIGGTGTISMAITKALAETDCELYLFNRGTRNETLPKNINIIKGDINNEAEAAELLKDYTFDVVCDFLIPEGVSRYVERVKNRKTHKKTMLNTFRRPVLLP